MQSYTKIIGHIGSPQPDLPWRPTVSLFHLLNYFGVIHCLVVTHNPYWREGTSRTRTVLCFDM